MHHGNDRQRRQLQQAWQQRAGNEVPPFDMAWQAAAARRDARRRQRRWLAAAAVIVLASALTLYLQVPQQDMQYIEVAELLETTYWSAPSDVLLPDSEFDIYQDMPVLFESTEPAEGALL